MDVLMITSISVLVIVFGICLYFLTSFSKSSFFSVLSFIAYAGIIHFKSIILKSEPKVKQEPTRVVRNAAPTRVGGVRVRRAAGASRKKVEVEDDFEGNELGDEEDEDAIGYAEDHGKIGAKKARKLEMKAEKKALREAMEAEREELKQRQEERDAERRKKELKKEMEEKEEAERQEAIRLEKKRKEEEEYQKLKVMFSVDEEGTDKLDEDQSANLLQEFIQHIKDEKVVIIEDLAVKFKLKAQDCIDRIKDLCEKGDLTGVMDDRGKFIYITNQEYLDVARFMKQRGRVSIAELSESINNIINLQGSLVTPTVC